MSRIEKSEKKYNAWTLISNTMIIWPLNGQNKGVFFYLLPNTILGSQIAFVCSVIPGKDSPNDFIWQGPFKK